MEKKLNIKCDNSLSVNWNEFTDGTEDVVLISNFPFETTTELNKSEEGRETVELWRNICSGKGRKLGKTCDTAFLNKALDEGYSDFRAITNATTIKFVDGYKADDTYMWTGDAGITVSELVPGESIKIKSSKYLTNWAQLTRLADFEGTERSDLSKPGWVECCTVAKKFYVPEGSACAVDVNVDTDFVMNKVMSVKDGWKLIKPLANKVLDNIVLRDPTEWTKKAVQSKAWCVWCDKTCAHVGDGVVPRMGVAIYTFPLFQGDDLDHYNDMSDDEIFQELYQKYQALTNK